MRRRFKIDTFPTEEIIKLVCDEYSITPDEFNSSFKYGALPEARQLFCMALLSYGAGNADISKLTGYDPGRVSYTIMAANKMLMSTPFFKRRHDRLLKILNKLL